MILDSSFLIDLQNEKPGAIRKLGELEENDSPQRVPDIVVSELFIGVGKGSQSVENAKRIKEVLSDLDEAEFNREIAMAAGELEGEIQRHRDQELDEEVDSGIGLPDAIIAVTAESYEEPVLTDNETDFEAADVEIETY